MYCGAADSEEDEDDYDEYRPEREMYNPVYLKDENRYFGGDYEERSAVFCGSCAACFFGGLTIKKSLYKQIIRALVWTLVSDEIPEELLCECVADTGKDILSCDFSKKFASFGKFSLVKEKISSKRPRSPSDSSEVDSEAPSKKIKL